MKNSILILMLMFLITSCASTIKFPVSSIVPASEITVKTKKDKNHNTVIYITAKNLASSERLSPPKKMYVVWITTKDNGIKNIGQLKNKNGKRASLKTITAFEPVEIFITAEDEGNITYPSGIEISRVAF